MKVHTRIRYEPVDLSNCFDVSDLDFLADTQHMEEPTEKNNTNIGNDHLGRYKKLEICLIITSCTIKMCPPKVAGRNFMSKCAVIDLANLAWK